MYDKILQCNSLPLHRPVLWMQGIILAIVLNHIFFSLGQRCRVGFVAAEIGKRLL